MDIARTIITIIFLALFAALIVAYMAYKCSTTCKM